MRAKARFLSLTTLAALAALTTACRSVPLDRAAPPVATLVADDVQSAHLEAGRAIYTGACTRCHAAKAIADHSASEWTDAILPKMAKKARLTPAQTGDVQAYILAARDAAPSPPIDDARRPWPGLRR